ncbi:MAG: HAD family hydrolase [Candidatus Micrarchaeota archaeon]
MEKIALVFDVDETITKEDAIFQFFEVFGKRKEAEKIYEWVKSNPGRISKEFGIPRSKIYPSIDVELILKEILNEKGEIPVEFFEQIGESARLAKGAKEFFQYFTKNRQFEVFFITSEYRPISESIAKRLGVPENNIFCTELKIERRKMVGFKGPVMESKKKLIALRQIAKRGFAYSCIFAFGDSESDKYFIGEAVQKGGVGIVVRKNAELIRFAKPQYVQSEPDFGKLMKIVNDEAEKRGNL